jgi:hypothetical protein
MEKCKKEKLQYYFSTSLRIFSLPSEGRNGSIGA